MFKTGPWLRKLWSYLGPQVIVLIMFVFAIVFDNAVARALRAHCVAMTMDGKTCKFAKCLAKGLPPQIQKVKSQLLVIPGMKACWILTRSIT